MNNLMTKYINAYMSAKGSEVQKVKYILMHYAHTWEWDAQDALVADLLDDQNITADDIVEFLAMTYETDGGNREFACAVKALEVCLQKARLHEMKPVKEVFVDTFEDGVADEEGYFVPGMNDFIKQNSLYH
jgi:hypothetical protein